MGLNGPDWGPASKGPPAQLVVICHGVGANGADLIGLAPAWAWRLPRAVFAAPDAPEPHDTAPMGRQWFSIADRNPAKLSAGVRVAAGHLDRFLDAELARLSLSPDAYALVGFSQGAMTALFTGLRRDVPPRGILAYSGALLAPEALEAELRNRAPVLLVHGEADDVVPAFRSREAERALRKAGIPVETLLLPGIGHWLDPAGLEAGLRFLGRVFS
ncbi:MAG: prolyl oligopeptidase family serine peptidase [Acetobacteraceae bacterium]|nr:prolyl oligopeptidase family serine peptidase [Acetobacteraceae bacterium]MBV8521647.1 prolyl oligopeptidase family serine peptidase [Acetobacteraceae bacterium]